MFATHLINKMPLNFIGFHSPYEKLNGNKYNLGHLKSFGCLCSISTIKAYRTKFDSRAQFCVLLCYPPGQKTYKVLCQYW